ncbi:MAG: hypothetical protein IIA67_09975 [Planctomycetes bacterium]|nr:hypothetical protein [Planctomycetota bacterium]
MQKRRSHRIAISFAGFILAFVALTASGCASSKPQGATSFAADWERIRQGFRDGTPITSRGQEISRSLDSRFGEPRG